MLRILIAEDEVLEREALKLIIQKNMASILEVEEAANGRSALSRIASFKPDIVFLDIHMPGLNGIETAKKIKQIDPQIRIVFLTAYNEFEYAHEAIRIGVEDFIVKPASEERIVDLLNTLISTLSKEKQERIERENAELRLDTFSLYLETEFVYSMAVRGMSVEKYTSFSSILDRDIAGGRGGLLKIHYDSYPLSVDTGYQRDVLKKRVIALIRTALAEKGVALMVNLESSSPFLFFHCTDTCDSLVSDEIFRSLLKEIVSHILKALSLRVDIGYGRVFMKPENGKASFQEARRNFIGIEESVQSIIETTPAEENNRGEHSPDTLPLEFELEIEEALIQGESTQVFDTFSAIQLWFQTSSLPLSAQKKLLGELSVVLRHAVTMHLRSQVTLRADQNISESVSVEQLYTDFSILLHELSDLISSEYREADSSVITSAKEYMRSHYKSSISLEEIADYCGLSTAYFSRLFKRETDSNVIEYLTRLRLQEAKLLLRGTDLSMKEISTAVGYNDANYFTRVFNRVENCSPTSYRSKKILKEQKM